MGTRVNLHCACEFCTHTHGPQELSTARCLKAAVLRKCPHIKSVRDTPLSGVTKASKESSGGRVSDCRRHSLMQPCAQLSGLKSQMRCGRALTAPNCPCHPCTNSLATRSRTPLGTAHRLCDKTGVDGRPR